MQTQAHTRVRYHTTNVAGLRIFHREAGNPNKPAILLLTGFPGASHTFGQLIDLLKNDFHLIAPDYPGFGHSAAPAANEFDYTFDTLAKVLEQWIDQLGLVRFSLYAHDYGGPIGFRIASRRPELIESLIIQNANAYEAGIGPGFGAAMPFLQNRTVETELPIRGLMTLDGVKMVYETGAENPSRINPDHYVLDHLLLNRPGLVDIHLNLLHNYTSNFSQFEVWQQYFRQYQPATLLVWGQNDPFFPEAAARAFLTDLPNAELHLFNTGHFALEEFADEIAAAINAFLAPIAV
ncbi:alpha/beta hydrolase [Spirosoma sp. SC4-14]|uniref:alpha/beta fold hydrolase n=1 Tax=Spirosoma sp. SC4-14 TaxID=3128900 RepID=UPI0030D4DB4C